MAKKNAKNNAGVPGAQKQGSHVASKQNDGTWVIKDGNGTIVESGLSSDESSTKLKQYNKSG